MTHSSNRNVFFPSFIPCGCWCLFHLWFHSVYSRSIISLYFLPRRSWNKFPPLLNLQVFFHSFDNFPDLDAEALPRRKHVQHNSKNTETTSIDKKTIAVCTQLIDAVHCAHCTSSTVYCTAYGKHVYMWNDDYAFNVHVNWSFARNVIWFSFFVVYYKLGVN